MFGKAAMSASGADTDINNYSGFLTLKLGLQRASLSIVHLAMACLSVIQQKLRRTLRLLRCLALQNARLALRRPQLHSPINVVLRLGENSPHHHQDA